MTRDHRDVAAAASGIDLWLRLAGESGVAHLPQSLSEYALSALERQRESGLATVVYLVGRLVNAGRYKDEHLARITHVLDELYQTLDYRAIDPESRFAISASLLRAACVRLSHSLRAVGITTQPITTWLEAASSDPLPEVRYALAEGDV